MEVGIKTEKLDEEENLCEFNNQVCQRATVGQDKSLTTTMTTSLAQNDPSVTVTMNKNFSTNKTSRRAKATITRRKKSSRCGEVFVTNNARRWTFMCSYCNKSTRDIGEFICHIKIRHLRGGDDSGSDEDEDTMTEEEPSAEAVDNLHYPKQQSQGVRRYETREENTVNYKNKHPESFRLPCSNSVEIIPIRYSSTNNNNAQTPPARCPPTLASSSSMIIDKVPPISSASPSSAFNALNEFLDCGNFLDLNMHTAEVEDINYDLPKRKQQKHRYKKAVVRKETEMRKSKKAKEKTPDTDLEASTSLDDGNSLLIPMKSEPVNDEIDCQQQRNAIQNGGYLVNGGENFNDSQGPISTFSHFMDGDDDDEDFDNQLLNFNETTSSAHNIGFPETRRANRRERKHRPIRGPAYCVICKRTFQFYSLYRNHMIKHSNETPFECTICKKGFKSTQALRYHMGTHQKSKAWKCTICAKTFQFENSFIMHVQTHENDYTFPCIMCGEILKTKEEREAHLEGHSGERPFRCKHCNKLFRLRHHLSNHLKLHRQYRCDHCRQQFPSDVHLRKPYACPDCENERGQQGKQTGGATTAATEATTDDNRQGDGDNDTDFIDLSAIDDEDENDDKDHNEDPQTAVEGSTNNDYHNNDSSESSISPSKKKRKQRFYCKHCPSSYQSFGGLNFHIRNKHC